MPKIARILAIDGGGIRGLIFARLLAHIEAAAEAPIHQLFHLIAGTSTGGILGIGLSTPRSGGGARFSASELATLYRNRARDIFYAPKWRHFLSLRGAADERYDARRFEAILKELLGDTCLSQTLDDLLVTSYDISRRRPFFFESWTAKGLGAEKETAERGNFGCAMWRAQHRLPPPISSLRRSPMRRARFLLLSMGASTQTTRRLTPCIAPNTFIRKPITI